MRESKSLQSAREAFPTAGSELDRPAFGQRWRSVSVDLE